MAQRSSASSTCSGTGLVHAWIQDTMVATDARGRGVGTRLVAVATEGAREAGCEWLHVDFDDHLRGFYFDAAASHRRTPDSSRFGVVAWRVRSRQPANVWLHDAIESRTSKIAGRTRRAEQIPAARRDSLRRSLGVDGRAACTVRRGRPKRTVRRHDHGRCRSPSRDAGGFTRSFREPQLRPDVVARRSVRGCDRRTVAGRGADDRLRDELGDATFTMECTCGAALCRGTITGHDWRRPELQQRYDGHWIPALAALIGVG